MRAKARLLLPALAVLFACNNQVDATGSGVGEPLVVTEVARARRLAETHAAPVQGNPDMSVAGNPELPDCKRCHDANTAAQAPRTKPGERASHWEVKLAHAQGMTCRTCHDPKAPAGLQALSGPVSFGEAYLLCGTCHKDQLADWRGGAHGKRLTGWSEPRVVKNCAGCHNPHAPAFAQRMPVAYPTIVPERLASPGEKD